MPSDFLEKTLEEILFYYSNEMPKRGFCEFYENINRQFTLPSGRRIDILTWEIRGSVFYGNIIELKKDKCCFDALKQGIGYYDELSSQLFGRFDEIKLDLILVGNYIEYELAALSLLDIINLRNYQYSYSFDGISFAHQGWAIKELMEDVKSGKSELPKSDIYDALMNQDLNPEEDTMFTKTTRNKSLNLRAEQDKQ